MASLIKTVQKLAKECTRLKARLAKSESQLTAGPDKVLRCAFCGEPYPDGTPTHKHELLAAHIRTCENHPIGIENRELRSSLKILAQLVYDIKTSGAAGAWANVHDALTSYDEKILEKALTTVPPEIRSTL